MRGGKEPERSEVATVVEPAVPTVQEAGAPIAVDAGWEADAAPSIRRGDCVGRYIIVDQLGTGGMGVVFSAYDPELDRRIALKLVHVKFVLSEERARLQARLLREAQALAKLSHPNVIAVHDVGTFNDDVFIAMELVEGRTLRDVLREDKPASARALELFVAAGRGLAAAHAAGLVHRDFKPDNVAVAADGRVCVLDFGLARSANDGNATPDPGAEPAARDSMQLSTQAGIVRSVPRAEPASWGSMQVSVDSRLSSKRRLLGTSLTAFGAVLGTRHYMAPEQLLGKEVDARADQFSFCVGLYRALFHKRPFSRTNYLDGEPAATPPGAGTSTRVRRAIMKGLEIDPARRHASMDALLAELTARSSRSAWWIAGGGVAVLGVAAFALLRPAPPRQPALCTGAARKLAGVWEPAIGDRVKATFVAVKGPQGGPVADRVVQTLDGYTQRWVDMHTETCEAAQVRGEQSLHVMDLRMQCLQRDLDRVSALAQMFASEADAALVDRAPQATRELPSIDACADVATLTAAVAPPAERGVGEQVTALRATLSKIEAMQYAGRYKQAAAAATKAVAQAEAVPYEPLQAEALYLEGRLLRFAGEKDTAEAAVRKALRKAGHARDHVVVAKSASELLVAVGLTGGRVDEAAGLIDLATAAVGQAGNADELRGQLLNNIGIVHMLQQDYQQARKDWEEGLVVWQRALGPDHPDVLKTVINLGSAHARLGKNLEAIKYQKRVIKAQQETLGPDHPALAISLHNLGVTQGIVGLHDEEIVSIQSALRIDETVLGPEHPNVSRDLQSLAVALKALKRPAEALPLDQRAIAIAEKVLGADHPDTSKRLWNIAETFVALGRHDEALAALRRVLAIQVKIHGPMDGHVADAHLDLSRFFVARKRLREAWAEAESARKIAEKAGPAQLASSLAALADVRRAQRRRGEAAQLLAQAVALDVKSPGDKSAASERLRSLAELYAEAGKLDLATATYERALAFWDNDPEASGERGEVRFSFAKAIAAKDRARATELAKTAREELASVKYAERRAEVEKWIAGR